MGGGGLTGGHGLAGGRWSTRICESDESWVDYVIESLSLSLSFVPSARCLHFLKKHFKIKFKSLHNLGEMQNKK
jgi:hypothetical protein